MTAKHFERLAAELSYVRPSNVDRGATRARKTWLDCCKAVAIACKATNRNFDPDRFLAACGLKDTE